MYWKPCGGRASDHLNISPHHSVSYFWCGAGPFTLPPIPPPRRSWMEWWSLTPPRCTWCPQDWQVTSPPKPRPTHSSPTPCCLPVYLSLFVLPVCPCPSLYVCQSVCLTAAGWCSSLSSFLMQTYTSLYLLCRCIENTLYWYFSTFLRFTFPI